MFANIYVDYINNLINIFRDYTYKFPSQSMAYGYNPTNLQELKAN